MKIYSRGSETQSKIELRIIPMHYELYRNQPKTDPCRVPLGPSIKHDYTDQTSNTREEDEFKEKCKELGIDPETCEIEYECRPKGIYIKRKKLF